MHELSASAQKLLPALIDLRRKLHRRPELGLTLPETQAAILEWLAPFAMPTRTGQSLSSVIARLDGARPGPTVLLRADMDALPMPEENAIEWRSEIAGRAHACGHDAHVSMLLGAAQLLAERRDLLAGSVLFVFQPGEEACGGAQRMIDEGLFDHEFAGEIARTFAIHQFPTLPSGSVSMREGALMAAMDGFRITVYGRGGHGSAPHQTIDPVPIACEIVTALQTYAARRIPAFDPAVITVGRIYAGTAPGVIPDHAVLEGMARSVSHVSREIVTRGLRTVAEGIAHAYGATAEIAVGVGDLESLPVTWNDPKVVSIAREVATELVGSAGVLNLSAPVMASEDFSLMLQRAPGTMVFLGTQPPGNDKPEPIHSTRMMLDEAQLATGAALHAAFALRVLKS
jgi:hippurate hydrolase